LRRSENTDAGGIEMKKVIFIFSIAVLYIPLIFAQEVSSVYQGKEIKNLSSAVMMANPGDYILLSSGKRYILTKEEIAIARDDFDYKDLSEAATKIYEDGTEIKAVSQAHIAYIYPDGQATHLLKTSIPFTAFMRHIEEEFFLVNYIDSEKSAHTYINIDPPDFHVFRASVQYQTVSDGIEELQSFKITVYNYDGENIYMRY
jgi:hypothetical protein